MILSSYNLNPVRSRTRPGAEEPSAYRATREPSSPAASDNRRNVPYPVTLVHDESGEWTATVEALQGCNARGTSPDEALERVAEAVAVWVETAEREGKEVPDPKSPSYSGRLLLRMPQTLHAELARAAERERVSLNQFITDVLSGALGWRAPSRDSAGGTRAVPTEDLEGEPRASTESNGRRATNAVFVANGIIVALLAIVAIVVLILALR
jgi:predicted RNase H-like HicB family nuclease